jgi:general secretion pathway protein A
MSSAARAERGPRSPLRLAVLIVVLVGIATGVGALLYARTLERRLGAEAYRAGFRVTRIVADVHGRGMAEVRTLLTDLAGRPEIRAQDPVRCGMTFADALQRSPLLANLSAVTPAGVVFCSGAALGTHGGNVDAALLARAIGTQGLTVGTFTADAASGRVSLPLLHPVVDDARTVRAVLVAAVDPGALARVAVQAGIPPAATFSVVDQNGIVLAHHPQPERWLGQQIVDPDLVTRAPTQGEQLADSTGLDGLARFVALTPLPGIGGRFGGAWAVIGIARQDGRVRLLEVGGVSIIVLTIVGGAVSTVTTARAARRARERRARQGRKTTWDPFNMPPPTFQATPASPTSTVPRAAVPSTPAPTDFGGAAPAVSVAPVLSAPDAPASAPAAAQRPASAPPRRLPAPHTPAVPPPPESRPRESGAPTPTPPSPTRSIPIEPSPAPAPAAARTPSARIESPPPASPPSPPPVDARAVADVPADPGRARREPPGPASKAPGPAPRASDPPRPERAPLVSDDYAAYWGLTQPPFDNSPNPRFLYMSPEHEEALIRLTYAVQRRRGVAMLTGESGCGKTTVARALIQRLDTDHYEIALLGKPTWNVLSFLREILYQLGVETAPENKPALLHLVNDVLLRNFQRGRDTVVIVDEAQLIDDPAVFEELRLLLNFQTDDRFLMTLVLIGSSELLPKVRRLRHLDQRIAVRFHLTTLDATHTAGYIAHRLATAGRDAPIFSAAAIQLIFEFTKGTPRMINNVCDVALLIGALHRLDRVDTVTITTAINDYLGGSLGGGLRELGGGLRPPSDAPRG